MTENYKPEHRAGGDRDDLVVGEAPPTAHTLFSNSVYDKLKFVAMVFLPALGALYYGIAALWELPKADEVVGTVVVIDTFLGMLLGLSTKQYQNSDARFDGAIVISPGEENDEGVATSDLNVSLDPAALANKNEVVVKVVKPS